MLVAAEKLDDKSIFIRLNTISKADDAIANDLIYHNLCWAKTKKKELPKSKPVETYSKNLADIELLNFIKNRIFQNPDTVLNMNYVNSTYLAILIENSANPEDLSVNYKKQLKELIRENINDIVFIKALEETNLSNWFLHKHKNTGMQLLTKKIFDHFGS